MVAFTHYITIPFATVAPGTGGAISWDFAQDIDTPVDVTDIGGDGLDEGIDMWGTSSTYTGRTIDFEGETYAIFITPDDGVGDPDRYAIPYNKADGDLAPLTSGGISTGYTPSGAQVFHALLFGNMLVNAGTLAEDGTPIRFVPLSEMPTRFTWWHVELESHEVVLANGGVPAESFIDYVGRSGFDNYDEYLDLVGADCLITEMPFARISARRLLPRNGLRGLPAIARRPLVAAPRKTAPRAA